MVIDKINEIKDTLQSLEIGKMGLHYLVDLGKESQKNYSEEDNTE